jgi:spore germination cell wall hydrolase CwlJ-like protein
MREFEHLPEDVLLATMAWGEARGESAAGILAVIWVAKNRSDKKSRALKDVILQPRQFSCFNPGDPNREKLFSAKILEPEAWGACLAITRLVLAGHTLDPTGGATNFYARTVPVPKWARLESGWIELTEIGRHVFGIAR